MTAVLAIVAAMPEEVAPLRRRLVGPRAVAAGSPWIVCGRLGDQDVALAVTGDGAGRARSGVEAVLRRLPTDLLIGVGVAGGVCSGLQAGELVWAEEVRHPDGRGLRPSQVLSASARDALRDVRGGLVVTVDRIVDSPEAKGRVRAAHAHASSVVVDLESAHYAAAAEAQGVPWAILRAVSDTADEALPEILDRCRDSQGSLRRARVVRSMLRQPRTLLALVGLHGRVRSCAERLAAAVEHLARVLPAGQGRIPDQTTYDGAERA